MTEQKELGELIRANIYPIMTPCVCGGEPRLVLREESFLRVWRAEPRLVLREESFLRVWRAECNKCDLRTGVSFKEVGAAVKWEKTVNRPTLKGRGEDQKPVHVGCPYDFTNTTPAHDFPPFLEPSYVTEEEIRSIDLDAEVELHPEVIRKASEYLNSKICKFGGNR